MSALLERGTHVILLGRVAATFGRLGVIRRVYRRPVRTLGGEPMFGYAVRSHDGSRWVMLPDDMVTRDECAGCP